MSKLVRQRLSDIATIVTGATPSAADSDSWGDELDFITPSDQSDNLREANPTRRLSAAGISRLANRVVPARSTNLTCIGSTIGKVSMAVSEAVTNQQINSIVARRGVSDADFIYYMVKNWSGTLKDHASGSATPIVNKSVLSKYEFFVPPLRDQCAIGEVLRALDDKIAANIDLISKTSEVLDATFALICGQPKETVPFSELATVTKGVSYRSADLRESSAALVTLKSFDRNGGYSIRGLKAYAGPFKAAQQIAPGELVVAQTDLTQAAEVIGRAVRVPGASSYEKLIASLDLAIIRPRTDSPVEYLLGVMLQERFRNHCRSRTSGTTVLHLASDAILTFIAPLVSRDVQEEYAGAARPMLELRDSLEYEMDSLISTRDAILPALMTGKLQVRDAERAMQGAGV